MREPTRRQRQGQVPQNSEYRHTGGGVISNGPVSISLVCRWGCLNYRRALEKLPYAYCRLYFGPQGILSFAFVNLPQEVVACVGLDNDEHRLLL